MGEISEMMLDGTLCEGCGVVMGGNANGYPRRCKSCRRAGNRDNPTSTKVACSICGKKVSRAGINDHLRDAHPNKDHWNE